MVSIKDVFYHHSMSTYTAFDNNPVFWADPSGADATVGADGLSNDQWLYNTSAERYDEGEPLASWGSPGHGYYDAFDAARKMSSANHRAQTEADYRFHQSMTVDVDLKFGSTSFFQFHMQTVLSSISTAPSALDNGSTVTLNRAIIYGEVRHTNGDGLFSMTPVIGPLLRSGDRLNEGKYLLSALEFGVALLDVATWGYASTYTVSSRIASKSITSTNGFLFRGITMKAPINIPVQRFGNMSINRPDYWGVRIGTSTFANRTFGAIKPIWNPLTQYSTGVIPKGTAIKFGIIGPQGWRYPGGSIQFILNSKQVIHQSSKIISK